MSNIKDKSWLFIITFLFLIFIAGAVILIIKLSNNEAREITLTDNKPAQSNWTVYVDGAVNSPGSYVLKQDDTVINLITVSGLSAEADTNSITIHVPALNETNRPQRVSLNRADAWLIAALPGVGTEKAKAIVDYRNQNGLYSKLEDLLKVKGIGKTIIENIKDLVTLME